MRQKIFYLSILVLTCGVSLTVSLLYKLRYRSHTVSVVNASQKVCSPCASTVVLSYRDFGPPSMSYSLLGPEWNQWKSEGHELPDDVDVKVVVYRDIELAEIKKQYIVLRGTSDYRHVEYSQAVLFLEENIKEVEGYKDEGADSDEIKMWDELLSTLKNTHSVIIENLGS